MSPLLLVAQAGPGAPGRAGGPAVVAAGGGSWKSAEVGVPVIQGHSFKEYKDFGQVWTVMQDRSGLIYIGVSGGNILTYDGVTWRKIFTPMSVIRSLVQDETGRIWVGGSANFGYLEPDAKGTMVFVSILDKVEVKDRIFSDVWALTTPQGVYFRSFQMLLRWDGKAMHMWRPSQGGSFEAISMVGGHTYTAQFGVGLQEVVGDELRNLPGGDAYKASRKIFLHPYDAGRMLVQARGQLLTLYDGQKSVPFPTGADTYFAKHPPYFSTVLRNGNICVTTLDGGVMVVGHDGTLRQIIDKEDGLLDSNALSAMEDREGAVWIGSGYGVSRVEAGSPLSIFTSTVVDDAVRFKGFIYAASAAGSVAVNRIVADPLTNRPAMQRIQGVTQVFKMRVFKDPAGISDQLLMGASEGVLKLEGDAMVRAMPAVVGPREQTYMLRQSRKAPTRVYIAHGEGVASMRWDGQQWVDEGRLPNVVYESRSMDEDADGVLWVTGGDGVVLRLQVPATGMKDAKVEMLGKKEGTPGGPAEVHFIDGNVFYEPFRSKDMLRWDAAGHKFVVDNRFVLPVDGVDASTSAYQDEDGSVWGFTSSSERTRIGRFFKQADGSWRLDEDTYRPLTHFAVAGGFTEPDGTVWAVGESLLRLDPKLKASAALNVAPLVRQVNSGTQLIYGGSIVPGQTEPELPPSTSSLSFQFASLAYGNTAGTSYQYLLEGADKDWSAWGKQKEANYSGLGPGTYRFRVRTRAEDGKVSPEGEFAFKIRAPWYRSNLAYLIYGLLLALLAFLLWRLISQHERKKARRKTDALEAEARQLEATVQARTQEISAQASEIAAQKDSIELLSEIGKEITASLDLNTILFRLYERVNQIVDATIFGVGLYHAEKRQIEYSLAIENGKRYAPYTRSTDDKNQFPVWCIDHQKPILLNDVAKEYTKYIASYEHTGGALEDGTMAQPPASMIYLPLIAKDCVLGVLTIQSFKKNAYTEQHLSVLQNLAAYTSIALDNANAYLVINKREHEVSERAAELVTINRITQALARQLDRDSLIQLVGDQVRDLFHAPVVYVSLLDRPKMMLDFPYTFGEEAASRPFGTGLTSQIIRTGQPLLINEDMEGNRSKLGIEQIGMMTASFLGVPIPSGGQIIGVISVQTTDQEGRFTEADQRLLSTIASAVGVAFHNALLFEEAAHARAAAEQADAAKSSFLSTVSHELRTPLTSVLGFAKIIRRRLEERLFPLIPETDKKIAQTKHQVIENLGVVVSEGERLTKLIDDVLDLAKIEAGKFTWNMGMVSVAEVIDRAAAATASLFDAKHLLLVREVEADLPMITGDQDRLIQVVINLISNAIKFTDAGSITCMVRREGSELVVGVKDSGIGIAASDQPKVFEKFKQVGDTLTDKPKGTGLGLPICREIVEFHAGRIWVESEPGQGSTFFFTLPITSVQTQLDLTPVRRSKDIESLVRQLRERVETHQSRDKSILVVDDDPNIRSLLRQELTEAGYVVRLAEDGRKALTLIREEIPGLIILDVMMPEMNGFDVAAVLKNDPATMDIPIIILSIVEDKERGFRLGVDRYLTKPIDTASLFHEVDTLLDQGKSKKKVMVVDEDASTIRTLTDVLETRGYTVVESNGLELVSRAVLSKPDIIILNSVLSSDEAVRALRFEKGMENVLFLIYP